MAYSVNVYNPLDIRGKTNHNKSYASKKGKKKRKGVVDDNSIRYCASFPSAIAKGDKETFGPPALAVDTAWGGRNFT